MPPPPSPAAVRATPRESIQPQVLLDVESIDVSLTGARATLRVAGHLPNSCYGPAHSEVQPQNGFIAVRVLSTLDPSSGLCQMMIRPFALSIELGELSPGEHRVQIQQKASRVREATFTIR